MNYIFLGVFDAIDCGCRIGIRGSHHFGIRAYILVYGEYNVSATSNDSNLSPFDLDAGADLRTNPFEERGNDGSQGSKPKDPSNINGGPMTKARAKKMKEALNGLIQEIWTESLAQQGLDDMEKIPRLQNIIQARDQVQDQQY